MYTDDVNEEKYEDTSNQQYNSSSYSSLKILIIIILVIIAIGLIIFAISKGKGGGSKTNNYVISIYPENIVVPLGGTENISYEVRNNNEIVTDAVVRLKSEDESIAKVDNLMVTGINYGKTILTIVYTDDSGKTIQDIKEVTVADGDPSVKLENVIFPDGDLQLPPNGEYDIKISTEPDNAYVENKKFVSSNSNIVSVDEFGKVTAINEGEAAITINVNNGEFKKVLKVYVNSGNDQPSIVISPDKITIDDAPTTLKEEETSVLKYTITPENASGKVTWSSSDNNIMTVDEYGKVTAIKEGVATIKVTTFNGLSNSVRIQVEKKEVLVTDINLSVSDVSITVGQTEMLVPTVVPSDATDKTLTFESTNTAIVMVNSNGDATATITGAMEGTATIIIRSSNGIEKTLNVTVGAAEPTPSSSGGGGGGSCGSCYNVTCGTGKYCSCGKCYSCPGGSYCYGNKKYSCPAGKGSVANSSSYSDCTACAKGYYSTGNGKGCIACPSGKTTKSSGATSVSECNVTATPTPTPAASKCAPGYYKLSGVCTICRKNYYCPGDNTIRPCGTGKVTSGTGKTSNSDCH